MSAPKQIQLGLSLPYDTLFLHATSSPFFPGTGGDADRAACPRKVGAHGETPRTYEWRVEGGEATGPRNPLQGRIRRAPPWAASKLGASPLLPGKFLQQFSSSSKQPLTKATFAPPVPPAPSGEHPVAEPVFQAASLRYRHVPPPSSPLHSARSRRCAP